MYRPASWKPQGPVWIVMHGRKRDAHEYLAQWRPAAERHGALLVVPSFTHEAWPTSREYPLGDVSDAHGKPLPKADWAFPVVDRAFEEAARRAGSTQSRFVLYGHGAGAQFVLRYVFFMGSRRLERAVAAGAGWYLLPDDSFAYPYGLSGTALPESALREALAAPLVLMVGLDDVKTDGILRNNPQTLAQGATRVDRARFALVRGRERAQALDAPFHWRLVEVPGVGHHPGAMLPAAERVVAGIASETPATHP
jgi:predicted esterase